MEKYSQVEEKKESKIEGKNASPWKYEDDSMPSARDHIDERNLFDIRSKCEFWLTINYESEREKTDTVYAHILTAE